MRNRYPNHEQLYALEREARRLRAEETARLVRAGIEKVRSLFARATSARPGKGLRHA